MRISDWSSDVCSSDLLFGAVRWIDAGADYIIEHPPPKCLGHDADEGRAVSCASYVRSNPGELVEVVPYDPRTVVQSPVIRHPGQDRYRDARRFVTRRYPPGHYPQLDQTTDGAPTEAGPHHHPVHPHTPPP